MAQKLCWGWGEEFVATSTRLVAYLPVNAARNTYPHTDEAAALAKRLKELLVVRRNAPFFFFCVCVLTPACWGQVDAQLYAWANQRLTAQLAALDQRSLASRRADLAQATAALADECNGIAVGSAAGSRRRLVGLREARRARDRARLRARHGRLAADPSENAAASAAGNATAAAVSAAGGGRRRAAGDDGRWPAPPTRHPGPPARKPKVESSGSGGGGGGGLAKGLHAKSTSAHTRTHPRLSSLPLCLVSSCVCFTFLRFVRSVFFLSFVGAAVPAVAWPLPLPRRVRRRCARGTGSKPSATAAPTSPH
jgi:hypothetical protein